MRQTLPTLAVMSDVEVERYKLRLELLSYDELRVLAEDLAFAACFDDRADECVLAAAKLPLVCAAADQRDEGKRAARRRFEWHVAAVAARRHTPTDWRLAMLPAAGPIARGLTAPIWQHTYRGWTPSGAHQLFAGQLGVATPTDRVVLIKEERA